MLHDSVAHASPYAFSFDDLGRRPAHSTTSRHQAFSLRSKQKVDGQKQRVAENVYDDASAETTRIILLVQGAGSENATIRGIISDLDGVAYRGEQPIPESVQAFRAWHARGVPYAFVTNNSTKSAAQFAAKLNGMGIPATAAQVFNTISATAALMLERWRRGTSMFAIGEAAVRRA
jgi:hypothetical protein